MKKLVPILLLFLAVLYGAPHPRCTCYETATDTAVVTAEHSCCDVSGSLACGMAGPGVHSSKSCCGMMNSAAPAAANSIELIGNTEQTRAKVFKTSLIADLGYALHAESVPRTNRAPPRIRGFGSSDTYLFKRVLLI